MEENNPQTMQKKRGCVKWLLIILVGLLAFVIIISIFISKSTNDSVKESDRTNKELSATTEKADSTLWEIKKEMDEMTDSQNIWASIKSDNYINQDFPYEGDTHASITVRYMKKYGYDVLINIDKGQIVGNNWQGDNYISARFDSLPAKKYYFNNSADYSSETVFLKNAKDFMNNCNKAKNIKIEVPIYHAGRALFSFHVDEPLKFPN